MKKIITLLSIILLMQGCEDEKPKTYKYVISVDEKQKTYNVTITKQIGGNTIERGAGGAIIGGGVDLLFGGSGKSGAIIGGLIGASTTETPQTETFIETRTDIIYTTLFSDNSKLVRVNNKLYSVGDSVEI